MDILDVYKELQEFLGEIFNQEPPPVGGEERYRRQDRLQSLRNPDYYQTNLELLWVVDSGVAKIMVNNSMNPRFPRRLEITLENEDLHVFVLNEDFELKVDERERDFKTRFEKFALDSEGLQAFFVFVREFLEVRTN